MPTRVVLLGCLYWGRRVVACLTLCIAAALAMAALFATPAQAANRTLDFDSLPASQPVADQYDDGTLGAVQFDYDPDGFHYTDRFATVVQSVGEAASSGTQVAHMPFEPPLHSPDKGSRAFGIDFGHSTSYLAFRYTHASVAMNVGILQAASASTPFTLTAYDANGQEITSDTVQVPLDDRVNHPISVFSAFTPIAYVAIDVPSAAAAMDDVTYDIPSSPPPPDYGFSWPLRNGFGVTLGAGDSADVSLQITRINGSAGNINLSASNVPNGVSVSFTPNPENAPGRAGVTMHLTASSLAFLAPVVGQKVVVTATPDPSAGSSTRSVTVPVTVLTEYDLRARGLEITQGIQSGAPGGGLPQNFVGNHTYTYNGVRLVAFGYKQTVVRFYADAAGAPKDGVPAAALLYGTDSSGRPLPGSPLSPDVPAAPLGDLGNGTTVTYTERSNDLGSFDFTIPPSWQSGRIDLRARVEDQPRLFGGTGRECGGQCAGNNEVGLTNIPFVQEGVVSLDPVQIVYDDRTQPGAPHVVPATDPWTPFNAANQMDPISILPHYWRGAIDITTHKEFHGFKGWVTRSFIADNGISRTDKGAEVLDDIDDWADDYADVNWPVGILGYFNQYDGSNSDLGISHDGPLFSGSRPSAVVNFKRPYTSVAHELGHNLGRNHASAACGSTANDNAADSWPDPFGYINGVGIDFSRGGAGGGPYKIMAGNLGTGNCQSQTPPDCGGGSPAQPFDYMSYCATDSDAWISDIGWNQILNRYNLGAQDRAAADAHAAKVKALKVRGLMTRHGAQLTSVTPGRFVPVAAAAASTPFAIQTVNRSGQVTGTAPMRADYSHSDQIGAAQPVAFFEATVPRTSSAGVRVTFNGKVVAGRDRSAHAPRVKLLSPHRGAVIGRQRFVSVNWRATDADQARRDQGGLSVSLDYSVNNGRTFSRIFMGSNVSKLRLPRNFFPRSRRARLRITVSDGFNTTTVTSGPFRSLGAPPVLRIENPTPHLILDQDATMLLRGEAFDDSGRRLRARALTWRNRRLVIGHGEITSTRGLAAGRQRITLTARDHFGRTASVTVRVILIAVRPAFKTLRFPAKLSRHAHSFRIAVRTSVTTTLRVGSKRFTVGPRVKRLKIKIHPGSKTLKLRLQLASGRLKVVRTIKIARR